MTRLASLILALILLTGCETATETARQIERTATTAPAGDDGATAPAVVPHPAPLPAIGDNATVTKISDGDTIRVRLAGTAPNGPTTPIRLIGIDSPESVKPNTPVQCFAKEAAAYLAELIPVGSSVHLVYDVQHTDRYQRVLAYVYRLSDGLFVNLALARGGYANVLTIPPDVAHAAEFRTAVAEARAARRGLWGAC